jgi:hypothetical protein
LIKKQKHNKMKKADKSSSAGTTDEQRTEADNSTSASLLPNPVLSAVCSDCGNELDEEEIETPYKNQWDEAICDYCYRDKYQEYCPVCEDYFDKPEKPTDSYFIVSKEGEKEAGIKMGVYHVLDYPVFSAAVRGLGSTFLWEENFKLMRECDVNSMLKKLHGLHYEKLKGAEVVCQSCAERFAKTENFFSIRHQWVYNPLTKNLYERGVIQNGR